MASITNMINLISGVTPRALQSMFMIPDLTETVSVLCKFRLMILFQMGTISSWLIMLATFDRHLISSRNAHRRRMSNMKNTCYWILIVAILSFLIWAESGYCFEANLVGTPQKCYAKSTSCRIFNDIAQSFITTLIPSGLMLVFGILTIRNVQQSQRIQHSTTGTNNTINATTRKDESSLSLMLIAQVILLTIFSLPVAGQKFYLTYTFYEPKTQTQKAIESFVFAFVVQLLNVPSCISFYLYTVTGNVFRKTLFGLFKKGFIALKCW